MIYHYISKYKFPIISLGLNVFALVSAGIWVLVSLLPSNQPQILQYANSMGIFRIGSVWDVLMLIFTGIIFSVANYLLTINLHGRSSFLAILVSSISIFVSALIFITVSAIIGVN